MRRKHFLGDRNQRQPASKDTWGHLARSASAAGALRDVGPSHSPPGPCAPLPLFSCAVARSCSSRNVHRTPGGLADTRVRPNGCVARTRTCIPHKLPGDFVVVDHTLSCKVPAHGPAPNVPGSGPRCDLERASSFTGPLTLTRPASVQLSKVPAQRSPVPEGKPFPRCSG